MNPCAHTCAIQASAVAEWRRDDPKRVHAITEKLGAVAPRGELEHLPPKMPT